MNKISTFRKLWNRSAVPLLLSLSLACNASAQTSGSYAAYTADINNDGQPDILVKAIPKLVMVSLDDDFDIPIRINSKAPSFVLLSDHTDPKQLYVPYQLYPNPGDMVANPQWTQANVSVTVDAASSPNTIAFTVNYSGSNPQAFTNGTGYATTSKTCKTDNSCSTTGFTVTVVTAAVSLGAKVLEGYEYNVLGRLIKVKRGDTVKAQYKYDSAGNRQEVKE